MNSEKFNKPLLVTTALEESWCVDSPIIFLGEWCKLYSNKAIWQDLKTTTCNYHWDDRNKLFQDFGYLNELYENLLDDLKEKLNEIHNVNFPTESWRILIGPWLNYFVQVLFDRWSMIQYAIKTNPELKTINLNFDSNVFTPNDMSHFQSLIINDEWNHFIYALILKEYDNIEIIKKNSNHILSKDSDFKQSINFKIKRVLKLVNNKLASLFNGNKAAFFTNTYLNLKDLIKLSLKFKQLPLIDVFHKTLFKKIDKRQRSWKLKSKVKTPFEAFVIKMIPDQIPILYLEGFKELIKKSNTIGWPRNPKIIFTSNSFNSDEIFKMYSSIHVKNSVPLIIGQHGGHYGIGKFCSSELHETKIAKKYLTWGWTNSLESKIKSLGNLKNLKPFSRISYKKTSLLLISSVYPRYSYRLYSVPISSQWIYYFENQVNFVEKLCKPISDKLIVRLDKNDFGWSPLQRWKDKFQSLTCNHAQGSLKNCLKTCKIAVSSYNSTTYLETINLGIPTVIFWDPQYFEIRESAIPYFNDLKSVGIFHESPQSAANHINKVWNDVESWWNSEEVKKIVNSFQDNFSKVSNNLVEKIEDQIRN